MSRQHIRAGRKGGKVRSRRKTLSGRKNVAKARVIQAARKIGVRVKTYLEKLKRGLRWCSGCRQFLPKDNFHKGVNAYCKICRKIV